MLLSPTKAFGNRILMGTGKGGKYQLSSVWVPWRNLHTGGFLVHLCNSWQVGEIQLRVYSVGIQVER